MTKARILADYVAGGTTAAEFDYMDGVTSNVQTQMDAKAPTASPTFTGTIGGGAIGSAVTGFTGIKEADMWRMTSNFTGNTSLNDNMERVDDATFSKIGTGMSFTNGGDASWTFPNTGIWLIQASAKNYYNGNSAYNFVEIQGYNGSSWDVLTLASSAIPGASNSIDDWCQVNTHASACIDVANTTNNKIKFEFSFAASSSVIVIGDSNYNRTYFTFIRLGDT